MIITVHCHTRVWQASGGKSRPQHWDCMQGVVVLEIQSSVLLQDVQDREACAGLCCCVISEGHPGALCIFTRLHPLGMLRINLLRIIEGRLLALSRVSLLALFASPNLALVRLTLPASACIANLDGGGHDLHIDIIILLQS